MRAWPILGLVVAVQALDVAVHVGVGQVEPVRVLSNGWLVGGATLALLDPSRRSAWLWASGALYTALNLWFLWTEGLFNPATDSLRIPLFGFVALTLGLTAWLGRADAPRA